MRLELEKITFCWDFLTRVIVRAITGASSPAVLFLSLPEMQWVVGLTSRHTKIDFSYPPCFKVSESCIFIMLFFVFFCLFLFQFKKSPPKIPYKATVLATVLFLTGAFLIIIGSLLLASYVSQRRVGADHPFLFWSLVSWCSCQGFTISASLTMHPKATGDTPTMTFQTLMTSTHPSPEEQSHRWNWAQL